MTTPFRSIARRLPAWLRRHEERWSQRPGPVLLRVYSATGRLVPTLVDTSLAPGRFRTVWNGRDERGTPVGSGVYVCEISSQGSSIARKMTLLK